MARSRKMTLTELTTATAMRERIAYLFTAYPLWSETFLRQDLSLLQKQGLDICPISLFPGNCQPQSDWPDVQILSDSALPSGGGCCLWQNWKNHLPLWLRGNLALLRHRHLHDRLRETLQSIQATHLHAEFAGLGALLGSATARELGLTFSVGIHANDIHCLQYSPAQLFRDASLVLACNQSALHTFRQLPSVSSVPSRYLPHGLDLTRWSWQENLALNEPRQTRRLLFAGRLVPKKGLDTLLRAMAILTAQGQDLALTVAGDGPQEAAWKRLASDLGLAERVTWRGVLTQPQLQEELWQSDVFCLPARRLANAEQDGLPNVILEAAAVGIPILASQAGSLTDFLTADTGWTQPDLTPETTAALLGELFQSPAEADRRRRLARQRLERDFDAAQLAVLRAEALLAACDTARR